MVTKIKLLLLSGFTFLFSTALHAQKEELSLHSPFASHTYELSWVKASPDQKYITFQKTYDYSQDTLALVSRDRRNHIIFQTPEVYPVSIRYSKKGYLFMSGPSTAKYLKLPNLEPVIWTGITKSLFLETENAIAVLKDGVLRFYNEEATLMEQFNGVVGIENKNGRLFYTQQKEDRYTLNQWSPSSSVLIYTSLNKKIFVDYFEGSEYFIHENNPKTGNAEVYYINQKKNSTVALKTGSIFALRNISAISKLDTHRYFVTLVTSEPIVQRSTVDIWYANDNHLGKKFQNGLVLKFMIWNPSRNEVIYLDDNQFSKQMDVGNGRFLLALNPTKHQDYTRERIQYDMYRYDIELNQYEELGCTGINNYLDPRGKYLLSYDNKNWVLYTIDTKEKRVLDLDPEMKPSFDRERDKILFTGPEQIAEYDLLNSTFHFTSIPRGYEAMLVNGRIKMVGNENRFYKYDHDARNPLILKIRNPQNSLKALAIYYKKKFHLLHSPSEDEVSSVIAMQDSGCYLYVKTNYNKPPVLILNKNFVETPVFQSNAHDLQARRLIMKKINFTNSKGVPLKGLLYYPDGFDPQKKYPMIVGIYERISIQSSRYLRDGFTGTVEGMNIRYYLNRGYFVYLPDIAYDDRGPGRSSLDAVESSLDALQTFSFIDFGRVGLMGHSHGGYETNFIATQSKKFATYVGGAGNSDLVRSYHSFNYDYFSPFYWQFEEQQYRMYKSFAEDKNLYIDNSPIYHAEKVSGPILLWTGTKDENIVWEQSMEFYLGLRRNKKEVIALFYKDGHSFDSRINREDLFTRISDWFDFYLKGVPKDWIMKKNK